MKKIFSWIHLSLYEAQAFTIREQERELAHLGNELSRCRESAHGAEIAHAREILKIKEQLQTAEKNSMTAVAMTAEKQKDIASLRDQIREQSARHEKELNRAEKRMEQLMDWIAKGFAGVPIFKEPEVAAPVVEEPAKVADPNPVPESDLSEAIRTVGHRARNVVRHLQNKKDSDFALATHPDQEAVKKMFADDKVTGEVEAVISKTA